MDRLFQALRPFIRGVVRYPALVVGLALLVSVAASFFVVRLRIDTDLANLIPPEYPSVQALDRLRETLGGESDVSVAIESPSFEANKAFAEALIPRALALTEPDGEPYLTRVEYRRETAFLQNNALYFATAQELDSLEGYLNARIEEAKLEANPFYFDLDLEDEEAAPDTTGETLLATYRDIVGKEYPVSDDSTTLVLRFYPSGSQTNIGYIDDLYTTLQALVDTMDAASYHPAMEITLAGRLLRQLIEVRAITNDVLGSFGVGVSTVLLVVVLYFLYKSYRARAGRRFNLRLLLSVLARFPAMALLIGLPLAMSLLWTFSLAYLVFGTLNLMTSTLGLVLFGLGIDYGIHFYARYSEERAKGHSVAEAAETTFVSTGQAVAVGALTTAAALYVLLIADFRGFSEFGFIAGTGILLALISMLVVLPALLSLFERFHLVKMESVHDEADLHAGPTRFPAAKAIIVGSFAAVVLAILFLPTLSFEYQFGRLEPEYVDYNNRLEKVRRVYEGGRRNPAYVVVDDAAEAVAVAAAVRKHAASDTLTPTIHDVEILQDRFPLTPQAQAQKLEHIARVREILDDPFLQAESSDEMNRLRQAAQTSAPITIEQVPEHLRKQFTTRSGEIGNFVIITPAVGLSDGRASIRFAEDVGTIVTENGAVYHAGSTSLVAADMLRLMMKEAPWMVGATFLLVVLLMFVNFRSVRYTLLATLPLVVGVLWMILLMEWLDVKLNFYNLVVLPAILGIGNDAGVHMVHRYLEEGRSSLRYIIRSTGEHITMASLTTMIGFAGLLLSFHPGLHSIGELAVIGIGTTLLAALLFLPALLQWMEDRSGEAGASVGSGSAAPRRPAEA